MYHPVKVFSSARILEIGQKDDEECIPAFLASIVHRLTKPTNLPDDNQFRKCAVGLLEAIVIRLFHHPKAKEVVLNYYNQQLFRGGTDPALDKQMLESLGRIAAATAVCMNMCSFIQACVPNVCTRLCTYVRTVNTC